MWLEGTAFAQAAAAAGPSAWDQFVSAAPMFAIILGVMYFVLIRPQAKKASDHSKMLSALRRNDEVVTQGGLLGRIVELGDTVLTLEIAPNVRVRVERSQITSLSSHGKPSKGGGKDKD